MTNREKYAEQILDIATTGSCIAVDKKGKMYRCENLMCRDCIFSRNENRERSCAENTKEWSEQEYVEPPVDWSKVPVDTKILVRDSEDEEWEVDRETAFYYRIVNRNTGKKKWLRKEYFHAEATNYPHRPCE